MNDCIFFQIFEIKFTTDGISFGFMNITISSIIISSSLPPMPNKIISYSNKSVFGSDVIGALCSSVFSSTGAGASVVSEVIGASVV